MSSKLHLRRAVFWIVVLLWSAPVMASSAGDQLSLQEVASGIYVHFGQHVDINDPAHFDIANIGFIIGERCVAVVDTGGSVAMGDKLQRSIRNITDKPICYVINTHVHYDHVLGNKSFVALETVFVGHAKLAGYIAQNKQFFLENFLADLGPQASEATIIAPSLGVEDSLILDLGKRKLRLTAYPAAHSHSDLTVFDINTKTLWTGDLLFRERIPVLAGSLLGWFAVLDSLQAIDVALLIPGHGSIAYTMQEGFFTQRRYLHSLLDEIRGAIKRGDFLESVLAHAGQAEAPHWLLFQQQHRSNVLKAFTELEWE